MENISRQIGSFQLSDISFAADRNEYVIILGPTGCGKTMLLETIAGIGKTETGRIVIDDRDVTDVSPEKRRIGFVYQRSMLFPHYTVEANICYGMRIRRLSKEEQRRRLASLAGMLSISHLLEREVKNLSGGEAQKVALARALAIEPPVLLLDEPLAPLDPPSRESLRKEIKRIHKQLNASIVHVTHDQLTARVLADSIGVMHDGRLQQFGPAKEIFERPANEFVARFIGVENVFHGVAPDGADGAVRVGDMAVRVAGCRHRGQVGLCVRPELIQVYAEKQRPGNANTFAATVRDVSGRGEAFRVTVETCGVTIAAQVGRKEYESAPIVPGRSVIIGFDPEHVHCFQMGD